MSIVVLNEVLDSSTTKGSARCVMVVLAEQAGEDGRCWPGLARVARRVNVTERQAKNLIHELETLGELLVDYGTGRSNTNTYWVIPPATAARLIQELTEQAERVKSSAERVKLLTLLERVKSSAERVKNSAQRVKSSAERVKPVSPEPPRTLEPKEEPTAAAGEANPDTSAAAAAGQDQEGRHAQQGSAGGADAPHGADGADAPSVTGSAQSPAAQKHGATSTENIPGAAAGSAALAVIVGALRGMKTTVPELISEFDYRAEWLNIPAEQLRQMVADARSKGTRYRGDLIAALDDEALRRLAPPEPADTHEEEFDFTAVLNSAPLDGNRRRP
ncbi:helix-turn-helix domain-containing protein [Deinococcus multiflagellatus]|uniref:Helix-turn-helix domain-containing protein n=1 Tax=Deinococcus multiflagellatus TaxID=1656887 RepID=A0ABW1ZGQ2_9DEIO|nr:helix-turn-helix domain-containing protein [Deinococcus multiflagellatus]MBZ9713787.1 helix-turn-helix domain-containing protein [Deinococcus multiflagellatus]